MAHPRWLATSVLVALALGAAACGKSKEERAFDEVGRQCDALVQDGATLGDAAILFRNSTFPPVTSCATNLGSMGGNDVCSYGQTVCETFWYWLPRDTSICGPTGCWLLCAARTAEPASSTSPICASRFYREQPAPRL